MERIEPIVNIVDVEPGSVQIPRTELAVGDTVFDIYGGKYLVTATHNFKSHTRATRSDGERFWLYDDDTITVIKGEV